MPTSINTTNLSLPDLRRQLCRLGGEYIVDEARILTETLDQTFVSAVIFLAILRANVDGITVSPDVALRHLNLNQTPSDDNRLPVSVYALARTLSVPYETVRRHVHKLQKADLCTQVAGGVIVPTRILIQAEAREATLTTQRAVQRFVNEAGRFGIFGNPRVVSTTADAPLQVARLSTDYFLDTVRAMTEGMNVDMVSALVLHAIGQMNTVGVRRDPGLGSAFGGLEDVPPDDLRKPISVYSVSRFLRLPYETTRRTCLWLAELGLVNRNEDGAWTVPTEVFASPSMMAAFARLAALTQTYLDQLAEYGVAPRDAEHRRWPTETAQGAIALAV